MWSLFMSLYIALLFVLLTPGILLRIPAGGSKLNAAIVHGIIFAIVIHITYKLVWNALAMRGLEGFKSYKNVKDCVNHHMNWKDGECVKY